MREGGGRAVLRWGVKRGDGQRRRVRRATQCGAENEAWSGGGFDTGKGGGKGLEEEVRRGTAAVA